MFSLSLLLPPHYILRAQVVAVCATFSISHLHYILHAPVVGISLIHCPFGFFKITLFVSTFNVFQNMNSWQLVVQRHCSRKGKAYKLKNRESYIIRQTVCSLIYTYIYIALAIDLHLHLHDIPPFSPATVYHVRRAKRSDEVGRQKR